MGDLPAGRSRQLSFHFAVINLIHCRLSPTRPFSERSPTLCLLTPYVYCQSH
ncbi:MAG: hypothetical protein LBK82_12690 [Planctomycetaceae bacterium]|nr:hypothetical protein [Planctomycetaceae bacterium]